MVVLTSEGGIGTTMTTGGEVGFACSVTGQTVVEIGIVTVTTDSGHLVTTAGGQLVIVETMVVKMVEVVMRWVVVAEVVMTISVGVG